MYQKCSKRRDWITHVKRMRTNGDIPIVLLEALATYLPVHKYQARQFLSKASQIPISTFSLARYQRVRDYVWKKTGAYPMGVFKDRLQILEIHLVDTATISPIATDQGPLCAPPGKYSDTFPSTHVSQATSPIFKIITTESIAQPELSMSRRRLALNIPSLQRHLSFTSHRNPTTLISPDSSPFELLSVGCLTPMTPAEQIMHTPCHPPDLIRQVPNVTPFQRPALRPWNSNFSSYLPSLLDTAILSPRITDDFNSASSLSQPPARRLSIVTPPDASPVRVPRRLSYSHNLTRSPFSGSQSNRTPLDKALESPLCIRSQRWTRTSSTSETPGNTYFSLPLDITSLRV